MFGIVFGFNFLDKPYYLGSAFGFAFDLLLIKHPVRFSEAAVFFVHGVFGRYIFQQAVLAGIDRVAPHIVLAVTQLVVALILLLFLDPLAYGFLAHSRVASLVWFVHSVAQSSIAAVLATSRFGWSVFADRNMREHVQLSYIVN